MTGGGAGAGRSSPGAVRRRRQAEQPKPLIEALDLGVNLVTEAEAPVAGGGEGVAGRRSGGSGGIEVLTGGGERIVGGVECCFEVLDTAESGVAVLEQSSTR